MQVASCQPRSFGKITMAKPPNNTPTTAKLTATRREARTIVIGIGYEGLRHCSVVHMFGERRLNVNMLDAATPSPRVMLPSCVRSRDVPDPDGSLQSQMTMNAVIRHQSLLCRRPREFLAPAPGVSVHLIQTAPPA